MCELLAMSANVPTDIRFSFSALSQRGGVTGTHTDGWGICFYEQKGCRSLHDPNPSSESELARFLKNYPIKSRMVIAHVRKANRGRKALENTHPFTRELWGRTWSFAHNGQLKGVKRFALGHYTPIGTTDSEHAFCWLLNRLRVAYPQRPAQAVLQRAVAEAFASLRTLGVFNALLGDGHALYASAATKLCYIQRVAPFGRASLIDDDIEVDFAEETTPHDKVIVIASRPLTRDEVWVEVPANTTLVFRDGEVVRRFG